MVMNVQVQVYSSGAGISACTLNWNLILVCFLIFYRNYLPENSKLFLRIMGFECQPVVILQTTSKTEKDSLLPCETKQNKLFKDRLIYNFVSHVPLRYLAAVILQVVIVALTPIVSQVALWNSETQKKEASFLPQTPYMVEFFLSVIIANIISLFGGGWKGFFLCWNFREILTLFPVSLLHGSSESLELTALLFMDGTTRAIIGQMKLPLVTFLSLVVLRRQMIFQRVLATFLIFIAAIGYIISCTNTFINATEQHNFLFMGVGIGTLSMILSCLSGVLADFKMKKNSSTPYIAQVAQLRLSTLFVVTIGMLIYAYVTDSTDKILFHGWNYRVCFLTAWYLLKDYLTLYVLKNLSALCFALCAAGSLCLTFALDTFTFAQYWPSSVSFCFILIVAVSLAVYALSGLNVKEDVEKKPATIQQCHPITNPDITGKESIVLSFNPPINDNKTV